MLQRSPSNWGSSTTGYENQCYNNTPWDGRPVDNTFPAPISVTAGVVSSGINQALPTGAAITGTVTAAIGGAGVSGVNVFVYNLANGFTATSTGLSTAADGTYKVKGLTPNTSGYGICFDASTASGGGSTTGYQDQCYNNIPWDGSSQPSGLTHLALTAGTTVPAISAALVAGGAISGTVTAASGGGALAGVQVQVFGSSGIYLTSVTTASDGTYAAAGLPPDSLGDTVCFNGAKATGGSSTGGYLDQCYNNVAWDGNGVPGGTTPVPVTAGTTASGKNAALPAGGGVSGTVTAASGGGTLAGVHVAIIDSSGSYLDYLTTNFERAVFRGRACHLGNRVLRVLRRLHRYRRELHDRLPGPVL